MDKTAKFSGWLKLFFRVHLTLILLLVSATVGFSQPRVVNNVIDENIRSEKMNFRLVQVVENLEHPWAIGWLPDGRMFVTERPGRMHLIDGNRVTRLSNLPPIHYQEDQRTAPQGGSQAGLLDLVVHPDYENNGWIYFTYSSPGDADGVSARRATGTALARARLNDAATDLTDLQVLYTMMPRTQPGRHYGSRIIFPGDGTVIFSIGDRGLRYPSQDLTNPAGSMIRLLEDGGAAPDNPFIGMAPGNLRPEIYSFGHRNNQGLAINPVNGDIWATDHGPSGGDLLYKIEMGNNYGWPQVSFGREYTTGEHIGIGRQAPGVTPPAHVWEKSMAPSGLTFYNGTVFPAWNGNLFAGSLLREEVYRFEFENGQPVLKEALVTQKIGRIRDVRQGPDGFIYLATDEGNGGIYRLEPVR
ncbi:MAG: PQQ-dependent sugar dehydrogenase [Bacteroidetes bacterium]|nr:MAG: PQQ-dependent sugar dehydrogenase [Bacteroidota bacterium]